jgi:hypothetical protein
MSDLTAGQSPGALRNLTQNSDSYLRMVRARRMY